jgi:hypothetical protein
VTLARPSTEAIAVPIAGKPFLGERLTEVHSPYSGELVARVTGPRFSVQLL